MGGEFDSPDVIESLDLWRLCDEVSVIQAALLIVGQNPAGNQELVLRSQPQERPSGFDAAFAALSHAIQAGRLCATVRSQMGFGLETIREQKVGGSAFASFHKSPPDWNLTTVTVDDLRAFLRARGIKAGFFFPQDVASADYLNAAHEHYSPKLAAAINAWEAVTRDPSLLRGKTVKQGLAVWLRRNADKYALTKEDGSPNEQGIEEVSKIANWDIRGGAPKTPGE